MYFKMFVYVCACAHVRKHDCSNGIHTQGFLLLTSLQALDVHAYVRMYVRVWANAYLNVLCVCVIACATVEQITPALAPPLTSAGWAPQFPPAVGIC